MKGYEIFKGIANKEIKDGTQFRMLEDDNIYTYRNNNFVCKYGGMNVIAILNKEFEIIEEQEEIDIQSIEELDKNLKFDDLKPPYGINEEMMWTEIIKQHNKSNELVQAVKQLDKKIKEER